MRVLIVDDENDICLIISRILRAKGIYSDCAHSLSQARQKTKSLEYELYIIDVNLPDGNGLDLIANIRDAVKNPSIVTISANHDQGIIDEALNLGAIRFVKKPFTKSDILELV
jgi:DNA-binding response OmpR family regulator